MIVHPLQHHVFPVKPRPVLYNDFEMLSICYMFGLLPMLSAERASQKSEYLDTINTRSGWRKSETLYINM
jgi:hypothetical protein